jgi:hypothetical protein
VYTLTWCKLSSRCTHTRVAVDCRALVAPWWCSWPLIFIFRSRSLLDGTSRPFPLALFRLPPLPSDTYVLLFAISIRCPLLFVVGFIYLLGCMFLFVSVGHLALSSCITYILSIITFNYVIWYLWVYSCTLWNLDSSNDSHCYWKIVVASSPNHIPFERSNNQLQGRL